MAMKVGAAAPWIPRGAMTALAGLGNALGPYGGTRHNAGFWLADAWAASRGGSWEKEKRIGSLLREAGSWACKPSCYMNESGPPVAALVRHAPAGILVVAHDDIELAPGQVRLKFGGGLGGHNGLRSVAAALGTQDFVRLRLGVGRPELHGSRLGVADWALSEPPAEQREAILEAIGRALPALELCGQGLWAEAAELLASGR